VNISCRLAKMERRMSERLQNCPTCFGLGPMDVRIVLDGEEWLSEGRRCPTCQRPERRFAINVIGAKYIPAEYHKQIEVNAGAWP
jgi:hypothetical protein